MKNNTLKNSIAAILATYIGAQGALYSIEAPKGEKENSVKPKEEINYNLPPKLIETPAAKPAPVQQPTPAPAVVVSSPPYVAPAQQPTPAPAVVVSSPPYVAPAAKAAAKKEKPAAKAKEKTLEAKVSISTQTAESKPGIKLILGAENANKNLHAVYGLAMRAYGNSWLSCDYGNKDEITNVSDAITKPGVRFEGYGKETEKINESVLNFGIDQYIPMAKGFSFIAGLGMKNNSVRKENIAYEALKDKKTGAILSEKTYSKTETKDNWNPNVKLGAELYFKNYALGIEGNLNQRENTIRASIRYQK